MRLRILDRYIFQEVVFAFFFAICAFTAVFIGSGTLFRIAKFITDYGASLSSVIKIFIYGLPSIIMWTFPMSILLATLLTFGRLSSSSEITAMKSCGISFGRIAAPAIFLGTIPWANAAYNNVVYYEIQGYTELKSQDHIIVKEISSGKMQRLIYAREYRAKEEILEGVTMQVFNDEGKVTHVENATFAEWRDEQWIMHDGMIYDISDDQRTHTMKFDRQILPVKASPQQIVREQKKPEELTMRELKDQIQIMKSQYANTNALETELYQRITVPMASLIFAIIGVPLGLQPTRTPSSMGFAISVVIIFVYYAVMTLANAIARSGAIAPMYAVWIPNVIGLIFGIFCMWRASK